LVVKIRRRPNEKHQSDALNPRRKLPMRRTKRLPSSGVGRTGSARWLTVLVVVLLALVAFLTAACGGQESNGPAADVQAVSGFPGTPRQHLEADLFADCLVDKGFEPVRDGIAVGVRVPDEQRAAYGEAVTECGAVAESGLPPLEVLTGEPYYDALKEVASCLAGLGYTVSDPPTLDVFLESLAADEPPWNPYLDLPFNLLSTTEWAEVNDVCPQALGA
jgi:predicted small secreted protein